MSSQSVWTDEQKADSWARACPYLSFLRGLDTRWKHFLLHGAILRSLKEKRSGMGEGAGRPGGGLHSQPVTPGWWMSLFHGLQFSVDWLWDSSHGGVFPAPPCLGSHSLCWMESLPQFSSTDFQKLVCMCFCTCVWMCVFVMLASVIVCTCTYLRMLACPYMHVSVQGC